MNERALNEGVLVMYGVLAGGARLVLPPMFDAPLVRTLRAAMFERMARARGVTLTAGARRILVDLEESSTIRGNVTQGFRWLLDRFVPYSRLVDASGNLLVYFMQPTITTALVGVAFLLSVPLGVPLAERLARDFCPLDPEFDGHPVLRRFFLRLSLLWAAASLVNATVTLWVLLTQTPTTFVVIKSFLGPLSTAMVFVVAVPVTVAAAGGGTG